MDPFSVRTVRRNWPRTVFRLLTLRGTDGTELSGSAWPILLLALFSLALWAGFDWLGRAPDSVFDPYDATQLAWFILAALLTAAAMTGASRPGIEFSRVCTLVAIVIPLLIVLDFAIETFVPQRWATLALLVPGIYGIAYCDRGLKTATGTRQPLALAAAIVVAFAFVWLGNAAYVQPTLWVEREALTDTGDEDDWGNSEAVLFAQSARIDASLAGVVRPATAAPVAFFVGFAGHGEQRVFAEEIELAAHVFGQRYDTSSRSVLLLNDVRNLDAQPLASVSGLGYALKGVASRMQLDRDILFLVLSSHGSADPLLVVSNGSIPLRTLSGDALAAALRESGIRWRVIVISACYAGAFIEPLQDAHTIVITAAAADRTSFGCADDRDLTYFGEAFFRDSLPQAASLRAAFDSAKALIAEREKQEGIEASHPQAFFGDAMERQLAGIEKAAASGH
jgi:hypothetical protein